MAAWTRRGVDLDGLICHSDAGSQYTSIAYTDRLAEIGAAPSIGTVGDSFDNAMAETAIGLFKTELHRNPAALAANGGPWRGLDDLEIATCGWVAWFNERTHPRRTRRPHPRRGRRRLLPSPLSARTRHEKPTQRASIRPRPIRARPLGRPFDPLPYQAGPRGDGRGSGTASR